MALTKEVVNDKIEVLFLDAGYSVIQVRTATIIKEDEVVINKTFHRHVLMPDSDLSAEDNDVISIAQDIFTADAVEAFKAANAAKGV